VTLGEVTLGRASFAFALSFFNRDLIMAVTEAAESGADIEAAGSGKGRAKKKLPLKMIIIGVGALAVVAGGGFAAMKMFKGSAAHKEAPAPAAKPVIFVDMPDVLVNLSNNNSDRTQYLKIKIVLEVPDQSVANQLQPLMPRVMDTFQTYLRELRPSDLDGSVGLFRLREELTRRVNAALAPGHVNAVLFKEIVIQ
jgi:flagellar FliL protein